MRETETIITFEIAGEQYTMFVEGILKKKYYLSKENKGSVLADPIPVKVTASTMKEAIMYSGQLYTCFPVCLIRSSAW